MPIPGRTPTLRSQTATITPAGINVCFEFDRDDESLQHVFTASKGTYLGSIAHLAGGVQMPRGRDGQDLAKTGRMTQRQAVTKILADALDR